MPQETRLLDIIMDGVAAQIRAKHKLKLKQFTNTYTNSINSPIIYLYSWGSAIPIVSIAFTPNTIKVCHTALCRIGSLTQKLEWIGKWKTTTDLEYADPTVFDKIIDIIDTEIDIELAK